MSPRRSAPKAKKDSGLPTWVYGLGIGVVVVLAGIGLFILQTPSPTVTSGSSSTSTSRTKGDPNAKIDFVEYSDFQ